MADYDLKNDIKVSQAIAYGSYDADQASAAHDSMGFKGLTAIINVGVGGITFTDTNRIDFKMTHSDDDVTYVAVTDDDVILDYGLTVGTGGIVKSLVAAHAAQDRTTVGYRGKKRYQKMTADFGGTHASPTPLGVDWVDSHPISKPVNQADWAA